MDELNKYLQPGKQLLYWIIRVLEKSTLVNAIACRRCDEDQEIRELTQKGRHTKQYRQMIVLLNGARIIDTPGMRELGMCDMDQGIDDTFSDIAEPKPAVNSVTADMRQNR